MRKHWSLLLMVVAALTLTLAGCGGKDKKATAKKEKAEPTEEEIRGVSDTGMEGMSGGGGEGGDDEGGDDEYADMDQGEGGDPAAMMSKMQLEPTEEGGEEGSEDPAAKMMAGMSKVEEPGGSSESGGGDMAEMMKGMNADDGPGGPGGDGMAEMMGNMMGGGGASAAPKTLSEAAQRAFDQGKDKDAFAYLYAAAITKDPTSKATIEKMRWVPGLRRPVMGVRWGMAINYIKPKKFTGSAQPIGSSQNIAKRTSKSRNSRRRGGNNPSDPGGGDPGLGGGGMEAMMQDGAAGGPDMDMNMEGMMGGMGSGGGGGPRTSKDLTDLTGDYGKAILEALETRASRGMYGLTLRDASAPKKNGANGGGGAGGMEAMMAGGGAGMDPAAMMAGGAGGEGGGEGGGGGGAAGIEQLRPGIAMLGKGTPQAMLSKAYAEGIDVLAMFEVKVTKNSRNGLVLNKVGLTFLDVRRAIRNPRDAVLYTAAAIDNLSVQRKRDGKNAGKKGGDNKKKNAKLAADDPVSVAVDRIFAEVDRKVKMANFPSLTEGIVRSYVLDTLVASVPKDPVPVLAEVKLYHHMRLMTDDTLLEAYKQLIQVPDLAEQLVKGTQEQQLKVLESFLPELPKKEDPKKKTSANGASAPVNAQGNGQKGGQKKASKEKKAGGFLDGLKARIGGGGGKKKAEN